MSAQSDITEIMIFRNFTGEICTKVAIFICCKLSKSVGGVTMFNLVAESAFQAKNQSFSGPNARKKIFILGQLRLGPIVGLLFLLFSNVYNLHSICLFLTPCHWSLILTPRHQSLSLTLTSPELQVPHGFGLPKYTFLTRFDVLRTNLILISCANDFVSTPNTNLMLKNGYKRLPVFVYYYTLPKQRPSYSPLLCFLGC